MSVSIDFSILDRFEFERKPVGIKYLLNKPENLEKFDRNLAMCEMFRVAQDSPPFYAVKNNFTCLGSLAMGMREGDPIFESGEIGATEGIFKEARANRRIYPNMPKLAKDTVRYVAFSSADKLTFDPDVLVITAPVDKAEILLRALCYSTGKALTTRYTLVLMCSWLFVYPYISGEANFTVTGLGYGMKTKKLFPEGLLLISVPFDLLPALIDNLNDMQWVLPMFNATDEEITEYQRKTVEDIRRRYEQS